MSPVGLLLLSIAFWLVALYLALSDGDEQHRDARDRNPRTWDDR